MKADCISITNEAQGRKALMGDGFIHLFKITGTKRKSEQLVWPPIPANEERALYIMDSWIHHGKVTVQ